MKYLDKILIAAMAVLFATEAVAATVDVPVGNFIEQASGPLALALSGAIAWALRQLPGAVLAFLRTMQVEQMLDRAISYGINQVKGATKGKVLTVEVGNAVTAMALNYVVKHGPKWVLNWLGGEDGIRDRIIARLDLVADAGKAVK